VIDYLESFRDQRSKFKGFKYDPATHLAVKHRQECHPICAPATVNDYTIKYTKEVVDMTISFECKTDTGQTEYCSETLGDGDLVKCCGATAKRVPLP
jgi:hypothetical protein